MVPGEMDEGEASASWVPHKDILDSVVEVLRNSLIPDNEIQQKVQQKIFTMQVYPDFAHYLLYVLRNPQLYEEHLRALSGIVLKNNLTSTYERIATTPIIDMIKHVSLQLLLDSSKDIRGSVTTLIGTIVCKGGISNWPDLIPYLCNLLNSPSGQVSETALMALFKIYEEYLTERIIDDEECDYTLKALILEFIPFVLSNRTIIRLTSIKLLNHAMQRSLHGNKLTFDYKLYLENLFQVMEDDDEQIQKLLCEAFCAFLEINILNVMLPYITSIVEFMLPKTYHENTDIALQACEFWLAIAKLYQCKEIIGPHINTLLPILLSNMRYSDYELNSLKYSLEADEHLEDRPEDIRPFYMRNVAQSDDEEEDDEINLSEGEDYESGDATGDSGVGWTLRKCSAATLDSLSLKYGDEMLVILLPLIHSAFSDGFLTKESGILALGAIADGCFNGLKTHLAGYVYFLLECMENEHPLIRIISCWTISRYMNWIVEESGSETFFMQVMTVLLMLILENNKRLQRAALSAFCVFQEEAKTRLVPCLGYILQNYMTCFEKYKPRSFLLLYDAIGVLAHSVGNYLNNPEYINLLLPPLMFKFNMLKNHNDEQFMALVECLSNVAIATESGFLPYAEIIYDRCLFIINETVIYAHWATQNPDDFDMPDKDSLCIAHDMLLGMAIGLKTYFVKFVTNSNLLSNLYYTLQDESVQVRQPALALYGELVKLCFFYLTASAHSCIPVVIDNIDKRFDIACNNAAWVIGRLCVALGHDMEPYASDILSRFLGIIQNMNGLKTMNQTVAIACCTLGLVCPQVVAPHLGTIMRPCCQAMRNVTDCEEKEMGFRGLCELVVKNPMAAVGNFLFFCDAIASWNEIRPDLKELVLNIIAGFKNNVGEENWARFYQQLSPVLKMRLNQLYGV